MLRCIGRVLVALLLALPAVVIYGHLGAPLDISSHYVSDFLIAAPHWPWLVIGCFCFAIVLMLLAIGFLLRADGGPLVIIACALFAAASMALFFMAYAPVRHAKQAAIAPHAFWLPSWWLVSKTAESEYDKGMADAYSDLHYHASRLGLTTGLIAVILLAAGNAGQGAGGRRFAQRTALCASGLLVCGVLAFYPTGTHGLWQRIGLLILLIWLWIARQRLLEPGRD